MKHWGGGTGRGGVQIETIDENGDETENAERAFGHLAIKNVLKSETSVTNTEYR
jgi:hypothetical protein